MTFIGRNWIGSFSNSILRSLINSSGVFSSKPYASKGSPPKWCCWIECFVIGRSVGIKVNDVIGHFFKL
jgi:hypothetical protein